MTVFSDDGEGYRFFNALEEASSGSSSGSDCPEISESCEDILDPCTSSSTRYDAWIQSPQSIQDRRSKFLDWMEWSFGGSAEEDTQVINDSEVDSVREIGVVAVPGSLDFHDESCSSQSTRSNDASHILEDSGLKEIFVSQRENMDFRGEWTSVEMKQDNKMDRSQQVDLGQFSKCGKPVNMSQSVHRPDLGEPQTPSTSTSKSEVIRKGWLGGLGLFTCINDGHVETCNPRPSNVGSFRGSRVCRVRVNQFRKDLKELSGLYMWQDIQAHQGSILVMKFSPDGQFLASAGEDGIIRIWKVMEDKRINVLDIPEIDPQCLYFTENHLSKLEPFNVEKEKTGIMGSLKKASDPACVVFPPKVFHLLEKPLHEFHGHVGEILDLSWSMNNFLLTASVDETVRLWRVGCDQCLKVFLHNNYVTCVQFNPMDDNYFISGSIDGKARVWAVTGCEVIDWTDIKEIITSICYCPDGQGAVVGSINGICRFYTVSDNHMQLECQISLHSKKRSPGKRITSLQFHVKDPSKLMVTCADSQIRILHGNSVIGKYKGIRNTGSQIVASLSTDGKRIVSAAEDSTVYVWNSASLKEGKSIRSCEHFCCNASVAIPWCGMKYDSSAPDTLSLSNSGACFSLDREFLSESFPKGSATWPEERLPKSGPLAAPLVMGKSQYRFLKKSCRSTATSHAWGMVIVTAGWDGRIKSFHNYGLPVPT